MLASLKLLANLNYHSCITNFHVCMYIILGLGNNLGGVVLAFGMGDVGQLGLGEDIMERKKPALVKGCLEGVGLKQVECGGMHTVVLSDAGEVCVIK